MLMERSIPFRVICGMQLFFLPWTLIWREY
jgi:hypothetical protein